MTESAIYKTPSPVMYYLNYSIKHTKWRRQTTSLEVGRFKAGVMDLLFGFFLQIKSVRMRNQQVLGRRIYNANRKTKDQILILL